MKRFKAAVMGGSGYGGAELIRRLLLHPDVELVRVASVDFVGELLSVAHPSLEGATGLRFEKLPAEKVSEGVDVVLLGLPHRVSAVEVPKLVATGVRIVDLSGDFRLKSREAYAAFYVAVLLVVLGLVGLALYRYGAIGSGGQGGQFSSDELKQLQKGAEAPDNSGITTVKEYNYVAATRLPEVAAVAGSNFAEVSVQVGPVSGSKRLLTVFSVSDNLIKGGAGQAIQSMNLMLGLDERTTLEDTGPWP